MDHLYYEPVNTIRTTDRKVMSWKCSILRVGFGFGDTYSTQTVKDWTFYTRIAFFGWQIRKLWHFLYMITFYEIRTLAVGKNHPLHNLTHVKIALAALADWAEQRNCVFFVVFSYFLFCFFILLSDMTSWGSNTVLSHFHLYS